MSHHIILWGLALLFALGCSQKQESAAPGTTAAPVLPAMAPGAGPMTGAPRPVAMSSGGLSVKDKRGNYAVTVKLPPRYPCTSDADCDDSRYAPGRCCLTECPEGRVGGTRAWVAAVRALWKRECTEWTKKNRYVCTYPKCDPKGRPFSACVGGKCTVEYKDRRLKVKP